MLRQQLASIEIRIKEHKASRDRIARKARATNHCAASDAYTVSMDYYFRTQAWMRLERFDSRKNRYLTIIES